MTRSSIAKRLRSPRARRGRSRQALRPATPRCSASSTKRLIDARIGFGGVRLKGGDPLLFGRAQEEIAALGGGGIAYEVVPGSPLHSRPPGDRHVAVANAERCEA